MNFRVFVIVEWIYMISRCGCLNEFICKSMKVLLCNSGAGCLVFFTVCIYIEIIIEVSISAAQRSYTKYSRIAFSSTIYLYYSPLWCPASRDELLVNCIDVP